VVYDGWMITEDWAAAAFRALEQAMDSANDLIGQLIRRLQDSRPPLMVVHRCADDAPIPARPGDAGTPRPRVVS
jgi:hypothetical protein